MNNINKFEITEHTECSADTKLFFDDVYKSGTRGKKQQVEAMQYGRSMIEMLGVLAIVGVLSVGGIAGYSKAMDTIKSNKRKAQFNQIFYQLEMMKDDIIKSPTLFNPATVWNAMNNVPDGLYYTPSGSLATKPGHTNQTGAYYYAIHVGNVGQGSMEMDFYLDKRTYDKKICTDFIEVAQNYKEYIHPTYCLQVRDYSNNGSYKEEYRGYICPKKMPLTPIEIDNWCSKFTNSYRFAILVHFLFKP